MTDFLDFEAAEDSNVNEIDDTEDSLVENVYNVDFIDDENESVADYYNFTNVSRSIEDAEQDSFIDFVYSQEANIYCLEDYDPNNEIIDELQDSGKNV